MKKTKLLLALVPFLFTATSCEEVVGDLLNDSLSIVSSGGKKTFNQISSKTSANYSINMNELKVDDFVGNKDGIPNQNETIDFTIGFRYSKGIVIKPQTTDTKKDTSSQNKETFVIASTDDGSEETPTPSSFKVKIVNEGSLITFEDKEFTSYTINSFQSPKIRASIKKSGQINKESPIGIYITDNNGITTIIKAEIVISKINNSFSISSWNIDDYYGNEDSIANRGEKLKVYPVIRNSGGSDTNNITATIKFKEHDLVEFLDMQKTFEYGKLKSFSNSKKFDTPIAINIDKRINPETRLPVTLEVKDDFGNSWTESESLDIEKIANDLSVNIIAYKDENGNKDFLPNKGEQVRLMVAIENKGTSPTNDLKVSMKTLKGNIVTLKPELDLPRFGAEIVSKQSEDYILFKLPEDSTVGSGYPISMKIFDDFNNYWDDLRLITVFPLGSKMSVTKADVEEINSDNGKRRFRITPYFRNIGVSPSDLMFLSAISANEESEIIEKRRDLYVNATKNGEISKASAGVIVQINSEQKFNLSVPITFYLEDKFGNKSEVPYKFLVP